MPSKYSSIRTYLPSFLQVPLFGNRNLYGLIKQKDDIDWLKWEKIYLDFYYETQKKSIGSIVNNAGYSIIKKINLEGKKILEIGPGDIQHIKFWQGTPSSYEIVDINENLLENSAAKLSSADISYKTHLVDDASCVLPFSEKTFDCIFSFYMLEHVQTLTPYIHEIFRVLKKGGKFVGAIPCEGGITWGLGRYFTSRKLLNKQYQINADKIICWEHPNFADQILQSLEGIFIKEKISYWPFAIPSLDLNLIASFIYTKCSN